MTCTDWRQLERQRIAELEARGLRVRRLDWVCDHLDRHAQHFGVKSKYAHLFGKALRIRAEVA